MHKKCVPEKNMFQISINNTACRSHADPKRLATATAAILTYLFWCLKTNFEHFLKHGLMRKYGEWILPAAI